MAFILTTLSILISWTVCAVVLTGLGCLLLARFHQKFGLVDAFWIGLACAVGLLQLWHIFEPVNLAICWLILFLGALGAVLSRSRLLRQARLIIGAGYCPLCIYILIVLSLAFRATGPCEHYDTGLYGATAVRWIVTYPIVPGLANLHGRLGFNSTVFLAVAALGQGSWRSAGHHLFAGLLVAGFLATISPAIIRIYRGRSVSAADCFSAILMIPLLFWTTRGRLVGTMTDLPATVVSLVAIGIIFAQLERNDLNSETRNFRLGTAMTLLTLAITFKLSVAVLAGSLWLLSFFLICVSKPVSKWKFIGSWTAISAALICPWLIGNVILSGFPLYPQPALGIGFDWKVSVIVCKWLLSWIRSWSRVPFVDLTQTEGFHWIRPWFWTNIRSREPFQVPIGLALVGTSTVIALARSRIRKKRAWLWLLVPSSISLIIWFLEAPATRFAEAAIWTLAAILGTAALESIRTLNGSSRVVQIFGLGILLVSAWCIAPHRLWSSVYRPLLAAEHSLAMPNSEVIPTRTISGLAVMWRADGEQCWDAPLPCTPHFDKTLRLRRPGNMRWGFDADRPQSFSDIARMWERPECLQTDLKCFARRKALVNRDHGGE